MRKLLPVLITLALCLSALPSFVQSESVEAGVTPSVQRGLISLTGSTTSAEITLDTPVPVGKSFVIASVRGTSTAARTLARVELTTVVDDEYTKLKATKDTGGNDSYVEWQVISGDAFTVQSGINTYSATTETQSISAVDLSSSFIVVSHHTSGSDTRNFVRARFTSSTEIEFLSHLTTAKSVSWYVVEWEGATVQRGLTTVDSTTKDQSISAVDLGETFLLHTFYGTTDLTYRVYNMASFTSTTNIQFRKYAHWGGQHALASWFVVSHPDIFVQHVSLSVSSSSSTATLGTAIDVDHSFAATNLYGNGWLNRASNALSIHHHTHKLWQDGASTKITVERGLSSTDVLYSTAILVEFIPPPPLEVATNSATDITHESATLYGNVIETGGYDIVERGFVWDTASRGDPGDVAPSASDYSDSWTESGTWGTGTFSRIVSGLDVSETYYFRAAAKNADEWSYGSELSFTTQATPTVTTQAATNVEKTTARLNMSFTTAFSVDVRFAWREDGAGAWSYTSWVGKSSDGTHLENLAGLDADTTYEFRAQLNHGSIIEGALLTFDTLALTVPTVTTHAATEVGTDSARLNMGYTLEDYSPVDIRFAWREVGAGAWTHTAWVERLADGTHNVLLDGVLSPGTNYEFRAQLEYNPIIEGDVLTFTTLSPPTVATHVATPVKDTTATLRGEVTDPGSSDVLEIGFDWGTSPGVYTEERTFAGTWGAVSFSTVLEGLPKGVTYYYRAKARNSQGWGYGTELIFATFNPSIYAGYFAVDDSGVDIYGTNWYAQTFVPYEGFLLTSVRIKVSVTGDPGPITVSIREVTDLGVPRTLDLVSTTYDGIGTGVDWYQIDFPEYFLSHKQYALVVRAVAGDAANYLEWRYDSTGTYPDGCYASSVNSGMSWTLNTDYDFLFEVLGHTTMKIENAQVFRNYFVGGDWLIVFNYLNEYPPYQGVTVAADYFAFVLLVDGTPITHTRMEQWGNMPGSIYIGDLLAATLEWGSTYQIRMIGLFDPYPSTTYTLIPADWKGTNLNQLDSWVITTAKSIAAYYSEIHQANIQLTVVEGLTEKLNEDGGAIFARGIPRLNKIRPHLFLFPDADIPYDEKEFTRDYERSFDYTAILGDDILEDAVSVGVMFGISGLETLRLAFFGSWMLIVVGAGAFIGAAAMAISIPFLLIGVWVGIIPQTPIAVVAAILMLLVVFIIWWRST